MEKILYGDVVAQTWKDKIANTVGTLQRAPHLVVVLVGDNAASQTYIRNKEKACAVVGFQSSVIHFAATIEQQELLAKIEQLNQDDGVDGILIQLPLPKHFDVQQVIEAIDPNKDVDGFHPVNIGKNVLDQSGLEPCTPKGVMKLLEYYHIDLKGKHVVIIGRSNIVGKPIIPMMLAQDATVSVVHSKTQNIKALTKQADILVVAIGQAKMVKQDWIKPGCIIVDVGINRDENQKLCGDVDLADVVDVCAGITPVPRGVGPMTIAMLLENTLHAYQRRTNDGL
ncbi:MAG: bifunctional methylenetetrahydrofolate dehydrogenase/methenyltetrahydrofolate cyclohydrolase FolD [Erysipelotrichaceae bacterium]